MTHKRNIEVKIEKLHSGQGQKAWRRDVRGVAMNDDLRRRSPTGIGEILAGKNGNYRRNLKGNIDNKKGSFNIDNIDKGEYSYKAGFVPQNQETSVAYDIASELNDLKNYAFHRWAVQKLTPGESLRLLSETKADVRRARKEGRVIRNPAALYNYKVKKALKRNQNGPEET